MSKILITGGSGFIGTNLINLLQNQGGWIIINIDIHSPKIQSHHSIWKDLDLRNREELIGFIKSFQPEYVIHLAARTDLRGNKLEDYAANSVEGEPFVPMEKE